MVPGTWYLLSVLQSIHKIVNDIPHPARLSGIPRNVETNFLLGYRKKAKKNTETRFSGISGNTEKIPKRFSSDGIRHLKTKYRIPVFGFGIHHSLQLLFVSPPETVGTPLLRAAYCALVTRDATDVE